MNYKYLFEGMLARGSRNRWLWIVALVVPLLVFMIYFILHCRSAIFPPPPPANGVLVTGAAGFIGYHTALALLHEGEFVIVVDELNDYYDVRVKRQHLAHLRAVGGARVAVHVENVADEPAMRVIFERYAPSRIVHLAARAGVRPSIQQPLLYVDSNIRGTTVLLEMAREFGTQHFVMASTSSVYGEAPTVPFREDDIAVVNAPVSPYAASKRACELMLKTYQHLYGFPTTALRFFTVYGPDGRPDMAPYMFIEKVIKGETIKQFGDGTTSRDYTYISDIVQGILLALRKPNGYKVYNLGRGQPVKLAEFIRVIERTVGKQARVVIEPMMPGDVPRTWADVSKANRELGYSPKVSIEEGIRKTVEWFLAEKS